MAKKVKSAPTQTEAQVGEIFSRSEKFIETYKNHIMIGVGAVIFIVVAILGVQKYYFSPKEREAQAVIFPGENYFAAQQWELALNGDSANYIGFLDIADEYSMTKTGKLAKAYAGICYYYLGNYEESMNYLKKYSAKENIFSPAVISRIGDCHIGMGNTEEGIKCFKDAAIRAGDENISPVYLKKAATVYESLSDYKNALDIYTQIKNKYPNSAEAQSIDKYIERANLLIK